ncbi:MAG: glucosaminidase domain-containing protein, partial [Lactococcus plantarum]|nr:glucosaminidase domain-containing protein [Lactococcus plantarum]
MIFKQLTMGPNAGPQLGKGYVLVATGQDQAAIAKNVASETKLSQDKVNKAFGDKSIISKMKSKYPDLLKNMSSKSNLADYVYPAAYDLNKVTDVTDLMTKLLATSDKQLKSYYKDLNKDGINKPAVITLMATSGKSKFEHRLAFVNKIAPYAQTLSKKYGILASISIAQAAHESNWDNSKLSSKYNNYFGVKTQDETAGKSVVLETTEYVDGKPETQKARFAVYSDWKDSMKEHAETLVNGNT